MIRLLPRPALLTSVVVAVSVAGGLAFGMATVAAGLALQAATGGRRP